MLIGSGRWSAGDITAGTVVAIDRSAWVLALHRRGLLFDSRFMPLLPEPRDVATVYLVAAGWVRPHGGALHDGPGLWVLREDELERVGPGSRTFQTGGDPVLVVAIVLPRARVRVEVGLVHGPRPVPTALLECARVLVPESALAEKKAAARELFMQLAAMGVVDDALPGELASHERSPLVRVWNAIAGLYEHQDTSLYLDLIASLAQISPRQVRREIREISSRMGMNGFRDTVRNARLRRAVLLLSARTISIGEIARIVGYGSIDAMGRAFRDVGLPAPSEVREAVLSVDDLSASIG